MRKRRKLGKDFYRSLALISQFGINMLVPIGLMLMLGVWLDRRLGTSWLTIVFFFMGAIAGGQNIYRMAKRLMGSREREQEEVRKQERGTDD